ncbi:helix-turn-helix transcriptional regulator [Leifsonia sp. ZF2019]|uniref:helix-turn-helix transcriptional regulator n=1 Tax=Leifsonia sp. ZF2019 TaxID=2781978 RepID=UPI001CBD4E5C|nr:helix-turn-helix transcriptional regulator [Leifsonia sp. ZF2019]UAJ80714.1 helix-turn-helix transcriptional regulator [Leifsonia sp. ZF2019]
MVITWNELRDARESLHLTQEELATRLGVSTRTVTNWEANGVARKAEYKVERFFGDALARNTQAQDARDRDAAPEHAAGAEFQAAAADDDLPSARPDLSAVSDLELLEELTRRALVRARSGAPARNAANPFADSGVGASRHTDDHVYEEFEVSYELPTKKGVALAAKRGTRKADQPHAE